MTPFSSQILRRSHRGFSFTEVLFAVMILGIGFIMVAAIFPVAIRQTEDSNRDTIAATLGRTGTSYVSPYLNPNLAPADAAGHSGAASITSVLPVTYGTGYQVPTNPTLVKGQPFVMLPGQVWTFNDIRMPAKSVNNVDLTLPAPGLKTWLWNTVSGNQVMPSDNRFAWVAMFKRDMVAPVSWNPSFESATLGTPALAPYAQVIVIGVQARSKAAYDPIVDVSHPPTPALLEPTLIAGVTFASGVSSSTVTFPAASAARIAEGAYIVVSDDSAAASNAQHGTMNGRIFRVGVPNGANSWQLVPGNDLSSADATTMAAIGSCSVLVVGRGYDPTDTTFTTFSGPAQDVAAYSTFVQVAN